MHDCPDIFKVRTQVYILFWLCLSCNSENRISAALKQYRAVRSPPVPELSPWFLACFQSHTAWSPVPSTSTQQCLLTSSGQPSLVTRQKHFYQLLFVLVDTAEEGAAPAPRDEEPKRLIAQAALLALTYRVLWTRSSSVLSYRSWPTLYPVTISSVRQALIWPDNQQNTCLGDVTPGLLSCSNYYLCRASITNCAVSQITLESPQLRLEANLPWLSRGWIHVTSCQLLSWAARGKDTLVGSRLCGAHSTWGRPGGSWSPGLRYRATQTGWLAVSPDTTGGSSLESQLEFPSILFP